ncbi:hypothetical protein AVEN_214831-1 [Araneus ventricosus]|uniref:Uncharacterized protein n=1 Tax=Araneus ventricosus TaxID=182803 RepID=A0A4Y2CVR7_ARAVE|nr:hypothetical protein AVEN_214831-1 [Araneus ventricosus]
MVVPPIRESNPDVLHVAKINRLVAERTRSHGYSLDSHNEHIPEHNTTAAPQTATEMFRVSRISKLCCGPHSRLLLLKSQIINLQCFLVKFKSYYNPIFNL